MVASRIKKIIYSHSSISINLEEWRRRRASRLVHHTALTSTFPRTCPKQLRHSHHTHTHTHTQSWTWRGRCTLKGIDRANPERRLDRLHIEGRKGHLLMTHSRWDTYGECGQRTEVEVGGRCRDSQMPPLRKMSHRIRLARHRTRLSSSQVTAAISIFHASLFLPSSRVSCPRCHAIPGAPDSLSQPISTPQPIHPEPTRPDAVTVPACNSKHTRHDNGEPLTSSAVGALASHPQNHTT